jgi:hypothetical protein
VSDAETLFDSVCKSKSVLSNVASSNNYHLQVTGGAYGAGLTPSYMSLAFSMPKKDGSGNATATHTIPTDTTFPAGRLTTGIVAVALEATLAALLIDAGYPELASYVSVSGGDDATMTAAVLGFASKISFGDGQPTTPTPALSCSLAFVAQTAYSNAATYAVGAYVTYGGANYVCKTAITVAEEWNAAKWTVSTATLVFKALPTRTLTNSLRAFVPSGNWQGESNQSTAIQKKNALGRIIDKNYDCTMAYNTPWMNRIYVTIDGSAAGGSDVAVANLETKLDYERVNVILLHALGAHIATDTLAAKDNLKKLADKLAALQAAGTIDVVTLSTAANHYRVSRIPDVPLSTILPASPTSGTLYGNCLTVAGATLSATSIAAWVTSTAYVVGDRVTTGGMNYICKTANTSGTFADDLAAAKWGLLTTPPTGVVSIAGANGAMTLTLNPLRKNAVHTLRYRLKNTSGQAVDANNSYLVTRASFASPTAVPENVDFESEVYSAADVQAVAASRNWLPAQNTATYVTRKFYLPEDKLAAPMSISITKILTADTVEISEMQWYVG